MISMQQRLAISREIWAHDKILPCCSIWLVYNNVIRKEISAHDKNTLLQFMIDIQQRMAISREI